MVAVYVLAGVGAVALLCAVGLYGLAWREATVDHQVNARMTEVSEAQRQAEIDLRFREAIAHEWPTPWDGTR